MTSKKLQRIIKELEPTLIMVGKTFFCEEPIHHILSGFYIDRVRSYIYFGQIYLPLCDKLPFIHIDYGLRLEGGSAGAEIGSSDVEIAKKFVDAIAQYRDLSRDLTNLEHFLSYATNHVSMANPIMRRGYANALILAGDYGLASHHLRIISEIEDPYLNKEFVEDTKSLKRALETDVSSAVSLVEYWELETKKRFDIKV